MQPSKIVETSHSQKTLLAESVFRTGKWLRSAARANIRDALKKLKRLRQGFLKTAPLRGVPPEKRMEKLYDSIDRAVKTSPPPSTRTSKIAGDNLMGQTRSKVIIGQLKEIDKVFAELLTLSAKNFNKVDIKFILRRKKEVKEIKDNLTSRLAKLEELKTNNKITTDQYTKTKKRLDDTITQVDETAKAIDDGIKNIKTSKAKWAALGVVFAGATAALFMNSGLVEDAASAQGGGDNEEGNIPDDEDLGGETEEKPEKPDGGGEGFNPEPSLDPGAPGTCAEFNRLAKKTLKLDVKAATRKIQERLKALGYDITVDGECGDETRGAVAKFQQVMIESYGKDMGPTGPQRNGVDGIVGPITWPLMQSDLGKNPKKKEKQDKKPEDKVEKTKKKPGDCFDKKKFAAMDSLGKLDCAWDNRQYVQIARTYNRLRKLLEIPVQNVLYPDGEVPKGSSGVFGFGGEESGYKVIRRAINQPNMAPRSDAQDPHEAALFMVNRLKAIVVARTQTVDINTRDTSGKTRKVYSYKFPWSSVIKDIEDAIRREIRPWEGLRKPPQDITDPSDKKVDQQVDKKVDKKANKDAKKKGIVEQLPMGELVGKGPNQFVLPDGTPQVIEFNDDIKITYNDGQYKFVFGIFDNNVKIKSAERQGNQIKITFSLVVEKEAVLNDSDLMSLLQQVTKPPMKPGGDARTVRIKGEKGNVKRIKESKHYDLDFSRWEKMFK